MASGYKIKKSSINKNAPILNSGSSYAKNIVSGDFVDIDDIVDKCWGVQSGILENFTKNGSKTAKYATAPIEDTWKLQSGEATSGNISNLFNSKGWANQNFALAGTNPKFIEIIGFSEEAGSPDSSCYKIFNSKSNTATIEIARTNTSIDFTVECEATDTYAVYHCNYNVVPTAIICFLQAPGGNGGDGDASGPNGAAYSAGAGGGAGGFSPVVLDFNKLARISTSSSLNNIKFKININSGGIQVDVIYSGVSSGITVYNIAAGGSASGSTTSSDAERTPGERGKVTYKNNNTAYGVIPLKCYEAVDSDGNGGSVGKAGGEASSAYLSNSHTNLNGIDSASIGTIKVLDYIPGGSGGGKVQGGGGGSTNFAKGGSGGSTSSKNGDSGHFGSGGGGSGRGNCYGGSGGPAYVGFFGYKPDSIKIDSGAFKFSLTWDSSSAVAADNTSIAYFTTASNGSKVGDYLTIGDAGKLIAYPTGISSTAGYLVLNESGYWTSHAMSALSTSSSLYVASGDRINPYYYKFKIEHK